jgi:hypothetical protein
MKIGLGKHKYDYYPTAEYSPNNTFAAVLESIWLFGTR